MSLPCDICLNTGADLAAAIKYRQGPRGRLRELGESFLPGVFTTVGGIGPKEFHSYFDLLFIRFRPTQDSHPLAHATARERERRPLQSSRSMCISNPFSQSTSTSSCGSTRWTPASRRQRSVRRARKGARRGGPTEATRARAEGIARTQPPRRPLREHRPHQRDRQPTPKRARLECPSTRPSERDPGCACGARDRPGTRLLPRAVPKALALTTSQRRFMRRNLAHSHPGDSTTIRPYVYRYLSQIKGPAHCSQKARCRGHSGVMVGFGYRPRQEGTR